MSEKVKLTIEFDNQAAAMHFALWLCGSGEQQYWDWMEIREEEEDGEITVREFEYHSPQDETKAKNDPARYKNSKFLGDNVIRTTLGRIDSRRKDR